MHNEIDSLPVPEIKPYLWVVSRRAKGLCLQSNTKDKLYNFIPKMDSINLHFDKH